MKLYVDIDGVLLTTKLTQKAPHADFFVKYITEKFDCYWLTTHCKGDVTPALNYLKNYFSENTISLIKKIKPTNWTTLKTEAINFSEGFYWLEDFPLQIEKEILNQFLCLENLILVDLNQKDELLEVIKKLSFKKEI